MKVVDTNKISNHFRYRKYNLSVYFGIERGIGIDRYQSSKYRYRYRIKNPGIAHHYYKERQVDRKKRKAIRW